MAEPHIALIIDKSEAYIAFQYRRFLSRWNVDISNVSPIESLRSPTGATLFGDTLFYTLKLEKADDIKKFNEDFQSMGKEAFLRKFANGLIITTTVARTSTAKLEKSMKETGVIVAIPPAKNDEPVVDKILSELSISRSLKGILAEYVGEDYDELLPLVEEFSKLPESAQRNLTEEDMFLRMPQEKGSVPPWDIEKYMLNGNLSKMIQLSRRVSANSSGIIWPLAVIRGKLSLGMKVAALQKANSRMSNDEMAAILGETAGKVGMCRRYTVGRHSVEAFEQAVLIIDEAERKIKGESTAPADTLFETALVRIALIFKGDK